MQLCQNFGISGGVEHTHTHTHTPGTPLNSGILEMRVGGSVKTQLSYDRDLLV